MIDNIVIDVVERYDVSQYGLVFEKQAIAFHLQRAVVLQGENIIRQWQTQLSPPQVDLKQQRETFDRLNPRWTLPVDR